MRIVAAIQAQNQKAVKVLVSHLCAIEATVHKVKTTPPSAKKLAVKVKKK